MTDYELTNQALFRQVLLAICSSLGFLAIGLIRGFSSPGIPSMEDDSPHLLEDENNESWIISIPPLGAFAGSIIAMPWMHFLGRKRVIQIIGPIFALCWIGIALSNTPGLVIFFRASTGFSAGVAMPATQVYVSECSHPRVRGLLASLPSVIMVGGILIQFSFGFFLSWRGIAWASAIFPAVLPIILIPFPESPPWLKLNGKKNADKAYNWFGIRPDLEHAQCDDESKIQLNPRNNKSSSNSPGRNRPPFCSREVLIPLSLALAMIIFQQTCGNDVVTFNTVMIFRSSGSNLDNFLASLLVAAVHFIFIFLSIFLVDKFGRKVLLIFSALFMGISMGCLSLYFFLHEAGKASNLAFLPVTSLAVYIAVFSLGFCTVPLVLVGEIFPLAYRSILGALTTSVGLISMFIELKTYSNLVYYFGKEGAFAFYSIMNFVAVIFTYYLLPETKEKSLEEIEVHFKKRSKSISIVRVH